MASMVVASMVVASMASSMAVLLAVLLLAPALPLLPAQTPPACDIWSARPCFGSQALDCAFRNLTREFGARVLSGYALLQILTKLKLSSVNPVPLVAGLFSKYGLSTVALLLRLGTSASDRFSGW